MDGFGPMHPAPSRSGGHLQPYVQELGGKRSMHFSILATQSCMDLARPDRLDLEYTRLMAGFLLLQPAPKTLAMIGLGGGSLARFCHQALPETRIGVAEINPHVIALREQFAVPPDSARFRVVEADGAAFVRHTAELLDVLLVDGYHAEGLPRSLSTQRFFDECAQALSPTGLLVMNLWAEPRRKTQVLERIRRSFGGVALVVDDSEGCNSVVFAANGQLLESYRPGPLRRPSTLEAAAWGPLQGEFARWAAAWQREFALNSARSCST
jgi:spermidine synthase